jgi:ribokinase
MGPSVVVVGSLNMDLVVRAPRRPEAGETLLGTGFATAPGGKGANQAVQAARLGASVAMVGRVGDDAFGTALLDGLRAEGISAEGVQVVPGVPTGVASIICTDDGENAIVVAPGANAAWSAEDVAVPPCDVLLLQLEVPFDVAARAAALAHDHGALVVLNAAPAGCLDAPIDVLVVNETEAASWPEGPSPSGPARMVTTLGAQGSVSGDLHVPAFAIEAVDTTAAGDAYCATLAVSLAEGLDLAHAMRRASAAGALACTRPGAQPSLATKAEIDAFLRALKA